MAQELTARSMSDLEHAPESPRTPVSPSRRRKFSFKLPHQHSPKPDRRHFAEEAASIPDIQVHTYFFMYLLFNLLLVAPLRMWVARCEKIIYGIGRFLEIQRREKINMTSR